MAGKQSAKKNRPVWKMDKHEGTGTIDTRQAPDWWLSAPDEVADYLRSLKDVEVFSIGQSAGGHDILAAAYGEPAPVKGRTSKNLNSAIAGNNPAAFYGEKRDHETFLFLGAAHGTEIEGTVGMLNVLNTAAKGRDLRGRRNKRLTETLRKQRIIVVPFLNMDGRMRYKEVRHTVNISREDRRRMNQGNWKSGEKLVWPTSKLTCPLPVDEIDPLGSYFNDNGMNLVYDLGLVDDAQPETAALIGLLRDETPDCVLCSHTNNGSLVETPSSYIPSHYQQWATQIGGVVGMACARKGLCKARAMDRFLNHCGGSYYQTDLVYHVSGALPLLVEFPCGFDNLPSTHEEILDICMTAIEEIIVFGNTYGYRPRNPR